MAAQDIPDSATIFVATGVLASEFGDEVVILNLDSGIYYGLDDVGARIWQLLQKPVTLPVICNALVKEYDIDAARCERDARALLGELAANGLVEVQATV